MQEYVPTVAPSGPVDVQHHLTVAPLGNLGSMDPMQWSIWSARASYPSHMATPTDPPNPLVQSTLLLHRVRFVWLYVHVSLDIVQYTLAMHES